MKFTLNTKTLLLTEIILLSLVIICYYYQKENFQDKKRKTLDWEKMTEDEKMEVLDSWKEVLKFYSNRLDESKKAQEENDKVKKEYIDTLINKQINPSLIRSKNKYITKLMKN